MSGKRYLDEFKIEAIKQVVGRGHSVSSVATRLDITTHSLYAWIQKYGPDSSVNQDQSDAQVEIQQIQKELKRVTDERDILKKAVVDSTCQCNTLSNYLFRGFKLQRTSQICRLRYVFIRDNSRDFSVRLLCRVLDVHPRDFYAWLQQPHSRRYHTDQKMIGLIKQFWLESGCVYGYRKIHLDLHDTGKQCSTNRVWRLMHGAGIKAQVGYRSPVSNKGEASIVTPNRLQWQFNPMAPDERWVTDITYIRTHEGWLYLAVGVLAYTFGPRTDDACRELLALLTPFNIGMITSDDWGSYAREVPKNKHLTGKIFTQRIERNNLTLKTRIKRLARKTIYFSRSIELHEKVIGRSLKNTCSTNWMHHPNYLDIYRVLTTRTEYIRHYYTKIYTHRSTGVD